MNDHKISADSTHIVCTADPDAHCRTRPDCDTESWNKYGCNDHTPPHPVTSGHDCWAIVWTNAPFDLTHTCGDDPDPEILANHPVTLTWYDTDIGVGWSYQPNNEE